MMTKKQKIWIWIFIAMFALPEILWSPVTNFLYSTTAPSVGGSYQLLRDNFLYGYKYEILLKVIVLIQTIGAIAFLILWLKNKNSVKSKTVFWVVLTLGLVFCIITLFAFYLAIIFSPTFF